MGRTCWKKEVNWFTSETQGADCLGAGPRSVLTLDKPLNLSVPCSPRRQVGLIIVPASQGGCECEMS